MKCMICNAQLNSSSYCPNCGGNVEAQKKVVALSYFYYNRGLEKAQIRDLSGAISCLKRSLKMYKYNLEARNLLGLVYFETGEVVAALSEWVISKNIQPQDNVASEYIDRLQSNANRLDTINTSIKKFNLCLEYCRSGNIDMAEMQLKKVMQSNPKLIKGYHLLSLIYIKQGRYEKARKQLKAAAKIDKTNTTTLRFLREVDQQTGKMTSLEPRFKAKERTRESKDDRLIYQSGNDLVIQPMEYRDKTVNNTLINLIIGLLVGASALWFLIVPGQTQRINQKANEKVAEYSDKVATQAAEINRMQEEMDASAESVNTANDQISQANARTTSYENLIKAWQAYNEGSYDTAANALEGVNAEHLSVEAKSMYDSIMSEVGSTVKAKYKTAGMNAYESGDYAGAVENLLKALDIGEQDFHSMFYLAQAYQKSGDTENAKVWYQKIIDTFPGTQNASDAKDYLEAIGGQASGDTGSWQATEDSGSEDYDYDTYSGEDYSEEDYSGEDYSGEEDYSEEDYSGEDYSGEDYSGEDYSEEDYSEEE
ncbi:MAG: tetratricopeptide repeat protein [Blautia sp.]